MRSCGIVPPTLTDGGEGIYSDMAANTRAFELCLVDWFPTGLLPHTQRACSALRVNVLISTTFCVALKSITQYRGPLSVVSGFCATKHQ